ncbi:MAG: hypothetical protein WB682_15505 [Candidatus Dormiibacterota bacterium]
MRVASPLALAAAVVLVLGLAGACSNPSTATPATPSPTPVSDYGPPPAGIPLIYVHDPKHSSWLIGFDWAGKPRGTIKLAQSASLRQAPDGSAFETGSAIKGGGQGFLDRLGQTISGPPGSGATVSEMWADDSSHMCLVTLDQQTFTWGLSTIQPGQPTRPVAVIARDQGIGQSGITPVACSFKNNFAILVRSTIAWPAELWIIRLSDGSVLAHRTEPDTALTNIVASPDAAYIAENSSAGSQLQDAQGAPSTVVRRVSDWQVVLTLPAQSQVLALSSDGTHVLITKQPYQYPGPTHLEIIDWTVPHGVWNYDGPEALGSSITQPGSGDFAIGFEVVSAQSASGAAPDPLRDVVIVHGDGTPTKIPGRYATTW